ncbi:preprotein translocase subunit SecG [Patescibacteria group bacterium]|nr:preprotein translocase subunit SecG [Patescibacteria group bacterium]
MKETLLVIQVIVSIFLVGTVLVQARGKGLSRAWGAGQSSFTRRGLEKIIFRATFLFATIFVIISILSLFI